MKAFPMFIRTSGRRVVIVGGDEEAAQKARLIQKTDARIEIIATKLDAELSGLVRSDRATHRQGPVGPDAFRGSALTFVATGCAGADAAFHALAKEGGALVNVVDRPELCDATTPSIVDRDPVVVAIGTEGTAPVLARKIKTDVETMLPPRLGSFAALLGQLRGAIAQNIAPKQRRAFWAWIINNAPARLHREGSEDEAARLLKTAIIERAAPDGAGEGHIALVGAGPGSRDLLTMRAVERLQEADIIFYDRLVDEDVLEMARRDAERVFVGKDLGHHATTQDTISRLIVAEAQKGRRVVRLKSGDPSIFGRATEELEAARAKGIPVEIVPGVTAASAAAAALGRSLTERGDTDTLVVTTGTCKPGHPAPDWAHHVRAGTTLAIYMGVRNADQIVMRLLAEGASSSTQVDVVSDATKASEQTFSTDLRRLSGELSKRSIQGCALLLVRFPKTTAAQAKKPFALSA